MISVGSRDARKRLGLGFRDIGMGGGGRLAGDTSLEKGEAGSNRNHEDYDVSIDPDVALSYIDVKIQDVLGHFQKDFETEVSFETLGRKFGGYGSFLSSNQRSPPWSQPKTPPKVQSYNIQRSPNNIGPECGRDNPSAVHETVRLGSSCTRSVGLSATKAPLTNNSNREVCIPTSHLDSFTSNQESVSKKTTGTSHQRLKFRIKMGQENLSMQKNAAIYTGLGLDVSPSSSEEESPFEREGISHEPEDWSSVSPTSILQTMTSLPALLSPLCDDLIHLARNGTSARDNIIPTSGDYPETSDMSVHVSDFGKGGRKVLEGKRMKAKPRANFSVELDGIGDITEKELETNTLNCEKDKSTALAGQIRTEVSYGQDNTGLPIDEENLYSDGKEKSKESHFHGRLAPDVQKETVKLASSLLPKVNKTSDMGNTCSENDTTEAKVRKHPGKSRDRYRAVTGDLEEQKYRKDLSCSLDDNKPKGCEIVGRGRVAEDSAKKLRNSNKKQNRPSSSDRYLKTAAAVSHCLINGPVRDADPGEEVLGTGATVVAEDNWVQCDRCQKWRLLPIGKNPDDLPDKWLCSMLDWLPGLNSCSINEEETKRAVISLYQVPLTESQNNHPGIGGSIVRGGAISTIKNHAKDHKLQGIPSGKKKLWGEVSNGATTDDSGHLTTKKNLQPSTRRGSLSDVKRSSLDVHKSTEERPDQDEARRKLKRRLDSDQNALGAKKKSKTEKMKKSCENQVSDYNGARLEVHQNSSKREVTVKKQRDGSQGSLTEGSLDMGHSNGKDSTKKRNLKECQDTPTYMGSVQSKVQQAQETGVSLQEDISGNDSRRAKKARSENKESGTITGHARTDKKESPTSKELRKDMGIDCVKRDSDSVQDPATANSSSSKVSASHRTKASFREIKSSPGESVSSLPNSKSNLDNYGLSNSEQVGRGETTHSPRRCSDGLNDKSFRTLKDKHVLGKCEAADRLGSSKYSDPPRFRKSGSIENETLPSCPQPVSSSCIVNGDIGNGDSKVEDESKLQKKQIRHLDHQNGNQQINSRHQASNEHQTKELDGSCPARRDSSNHSANNALKEAKDLKHLADRLKNAGSSESTGLYFQAALKFLHGASLLESCNHGNAKHNELAQSKQVYSSTAKLCGFCAHEYEKAKDMETAALAYKCMEVAYMRVTYSSHTSASRDRHELQTALQGVHLGESPSSSASDVDNVHNAAMADKLALPKGISSPQVSGAQIVAAHNRSSVTRLLNFTQDINFAMEASRKSQKAFANAISRETKNAEGIPSIKEALDFSFQDVEGLLRLVRLAMEAINR